MKERFETFVTAIGQINRCLQKLKSTEMADFGLKGTHVMCLYQLQRHPEGLTAAQLVKLCDEDKAAISRCISELLDRGLVTSPESTGRRYRKIISLTDEGRKITGIMDQKIIDAVTTAAQGYSVEERETFYRVLLHVSENLQQACAQSEEAAQ